MFYKYASQESYTLHLGILHDLNRSPVVFFFPVFGKNAEPRILNIRKYRLVVIFQETARNHFWEAGMLMYAEQYLPCLHSRKRPLCKLQRSKVIECSFAFVALY